MKKLTVLLAAVMAFAFSASAYATSFSDISEQPVKVQDSIAKTVALGIINGYEDGTFGPDQNITRAEFSKIAVTAAGAKDTADMLANNASSFKDVKAGQWYTGWVNASESLGIFQGDGNGNFRPNDTITNQEVITVLMRLLGYNDNLTGTWPVNYVTQANKCEILDDVAIVAAQAAKRGDVVVMLDATLDTDIVTYDKDTNEFVAKQIGIGTSTVTGISLLKDSFKGAYEEVTGYTYGSSDDIDGVKVFNPVTQVKDADKGQLTWTITDGGETVIIDDETRVSYNGGSLFDLDGHQGKVYFVKENDKKYARFIEVESYTKTTTATPDVDDNGDLNIEKSKIKMDKTSYNAASYVYDVLALNDDDEPTKNSNYVMYFNEDDQVYGVFSDKIYGYGQDVSYVKSVNSSTVKLVGDAEKGSLSLSDDVMIYTEEGFIGVKDLKVGDAIKYVADDLWVMVEEQTGALTKATISGGDITQVTIGGKNYKTQGDLLVLDADFEDGAADIEDIYGNDVKFILNKDNTVAAIIVDETSTGIKLYGIVMGSSAGSGWGNAGTSNSIDIFTEEGKTVTYSYDKDIKAAKKLEEDDLGQLVQYKLNKDGEIKDVVKTANIDLGTEVTVKNNAYLQYEDGGDTKSVSLASNIVIFEVDNDGDDIDVTIATRASVLAQDDFEATDVNNDDGNELVAAYAKGFTNTNDALRALAYTNASNTTYYYGVVADDIMSTKDNDNAIYFLDDENEYNLDDDSAITPKKNDLVIYTKSGDDVNVLWKVANKTALKDDIENVVGAEVDTYKENVITFETDATFFSFAENDDDPVEEENTASDSNIMTKADTVVFVLGSDGKYTYGTTEDIASGDFVYVIIADDDDYADVLVVDNYNDYED